MTKFEKSCEEFLKKYGYLTQKQLSVLERIKKERSVKLLKFPQYYSTHTMEFDREFRMAYDF